MSTEATPRIYVASLSDYNAGTLHGVWIDATLDPDEILACVTDMLASSPEAEDELNGPSEEWAIHDYDGFGPLKLSEWESFENVSGWAQTIEELGHLGPAYAAFVDHQGAEWATPEDFTEAYQGEYDDEKDFAYQLAEDVCIFEGLSDDHTAVTYFDYDAWARDLFMGDYYSIDTGAPSYGVYVFRAN